MESCHFFALPIENTLSLGVYGILFLRFNDHSIIAQLNIPESKYTSKPIYIKNMNIANKIFLSKILSIRHPAGSAASAVFGWAWSSMYDTCSVCSVCCRIHCVHNTWHYTCVVSPESVSRHYSVPGAAGLAADWCLFLCEYMWLKWSTAAVTTRVY